MAISLASLKRTTALAAPRILVHGVAGVGKTTFAAGAPAPVFICTEDGLGTLEATHFPLARTFDEVVEALAALNKDDHDFATVVIELGRLAGATRLAESVSGERLEGPGAAGLRQGLCRGA